MDIIEVKNKEKLTDKAFSRLVISSVLGIVLCIMCLCSTTYAWFTASTASSDNRLESGYFQIEVSVTGPGEVALAPDEVGGASYTLEANSTYTIAIGASDTATLEKGHCNVKINGVTYKTDGIYKSDSLPFTFTVTTGADNAEISFEAAWGIPAEPEIVADSEIILH